MPESFAETASGLLMVANGHDPVLRWDGLKVYMEEAGMTPPSTKITLGGSGNGSIVGTYYGYLRWVDDQGNVSNLSPISDAYTASGSTGSITGVTNASPVVITSASHGLSTGDVVKISGVVGNTSANDTWTITKVDANSFSLDDSAGSGTYEHGGTWISGVNKITYTGLTTTTDPKVVRRQILRNTDGQATTFYVDVDTEDLSSTSLESTNTDTLLAAETSQAILDNEGLPLANRHTVPPNYKSVIAAHKDRMFLAVDREYSNGSCQVTFGSTTVTGVGTQWTTSMAGRFLYVNGAERSYEIDSVDAVNQTLTLLTAYIDGTDKFAEYAIRPAPAERRLVYYSEAGLPESWPAINAVELQEDGDYLTGLMSKGSFLYILENRHIYRWTFNEDPASDGGIFLASNRGCINNRSWCLVDNTAYLLDEEGIYRFGGDEGFEPSSEPIADIFSTSSSDSDFRINWDARALFHAVHFPPDSIMRWFVCLSGHWLPRHAICYNYRDQRWWIEEYPFPIGGSCLAYIRNRPQLLLGGPSRQVLALGANTLDGPDKTKGTIQGTVTSSTFTSLTDSSASFGDDLVGMPLVIRQGKGKGQRRIVVEVSGTTLKVDQPWLIKPDTTSEYILGGIPWEWKSRWFRYVRDESGNVRQIELIFDPLTETQTLDIHIFTDFSTNAIKSGKSLGSAHMDGVKITKGSSDFIVDLTWSKGFVMVDISGHLEEGSAGQRFTQIGLSGVGGIETCRVWEVNYEGVQ